MARDHSLTHGAAGYSFHPLADVFPLMSDAELADLTADIREHGLREPIWLHEGKILDGRNRYRACIAADLEPEFRDFEGDDPVSFVVSLNLKRRHLNESQRAMVAAKIANLAVGSNQHVARITHDPATGETFDPPFANASANLRRPTAKEAGELLNVGTRSIESARSVVERGAPELVSAVERGEVSVSAAADVARLPKDEQREIVARGEEEIIAKANAIRRERKAQVKAEREAKVREIAATVPSIAERYDLRHAACIDALSLAAESVDFIVTDPPYPAEFLHVYADLGKVAAHVLKPGGLALVMVGQTYLPEIIRHLDEHLQYHWTLAYLTPGGQAVQQFQRRVNAFWKPVLVYAKGDYAGEWFADVSRSDVNDNDKDHHHWGQSASGMRDLMRRFVRPGQVVLDPFLGGGTTAVVALELGATFIGFDTDEQAISTTKARIGGIGAGLAA